MSTDTALANFIRMVATDPTLDPHGRRLMLSVYLAGRTETAFPDFDLEGYDTWSDEQRRQHEDAVYASAQGIGYYEKASGAARRARLTELCNALQS